MFLKIQFSWDILTGMLSAVSTYLVDLRSGINKLSRKPRFHANIELGIANDCEATKDIIIISHQVIGKY